MFKSKLWFFQQQQIFNCEFVGNFKYYIQNDVLSFYNLNVY